MPDEKDEPTTDTGEYTDEQDRWSLDRRNYLVGLGAALAGASALPTAAADISSGGPPDNNSWSVRVADDFEGGQLDTSIWSVGWGWGTQTTQGSMYTDERAISIRDSVLELSILNEPDTYPVGAVNTKNKETIGPGTYVEARTRSANLPGTTSNFWSKPNSEDWPPEIDFKETPIRNDSDTSRSIHHIHWTTDGQPNGPHADHNAGSHDGGYDKSENWTTYGCRWLKDSVTYYVNGEEHARVTDPDIMESVNNGAPFYVMLDLMNWPGPDLHPSDFSGYDVVHEVDWFRIWDLDADGSETGSGGDSDTDTQPGDHYIWFRSSNGEEASFAFEASEGNVHFDDSGQTADYTITDDGSAASGSLTRTSSLPGFWYDGELAEFTYSGPLDVFIDNEAVDPDSLQTTDDTQTQPGDHYVWFRSADGSESSFIFTASGGNIQFEDSSQTADYSIANDGVTAWGTVSETSSLPGFWYDGEIDDFAYSGSLDVFVDNEAVDPMSLRDADTPGPFKPTDLPRTVMVDDTDSVGASYRLSVTGEIESRDHLGDHDKIYSYGWLEETFATGKVDGDADAYAFSGDVSSLRVRGGATVRIDGKTADLVRIEASSDSDGRTTYLVETTGSLVPADLSSGTHPDRVAGGKAHGSVDTEADTFWLLDGEITDVSTFGGSVDTTVDGTEL